MEKKKFKSIWISDIHLGTIGCQANILLDFLEKNEAENLFLVGDIIDMWNMSKFHTYWPKTHTKVIKKFLQLGSENTKVTYITGNHDEFLREYTNFNFKFANFEIVDEYIYTSIKGKKFLIIHGDIFDVVTKYHKWIAHLGSIGYDMLIRFNMIFNFFRRKFGLGYWSISKFVKNKIKGVVSFIGDFENLVINRAKHWNYDGVICGHIHHAANKKIKGIQYLNSGDWVESCTAIVENYDGTFEILDWSFMIKEKNKKFKN